METTQLSDAKLVARYVEGDEKALEAIIFRYKDKVYSYVISKVKDEDLANDIFQDTFIKVINTIKTERYNEEGKFISWVMRIAHNLVIDHFRRLKRMPTTSGGPDFEIFDIIRDTSLNVEGALVKSQIEADLIKLIEYLPEEQKEVLKMRHFNELSFKEIADNTGVSINTALGRMRYALINLRKLIEKHQLKLQD
jgi:RNA polymerase sigma-70 factor (ECF subfamily)